MSRPAHALPHDPPQRLAGGLLIALSVLSLLAMAHHPTAHGHDAGEVLAALARIARLNAWVHGSLLALLLGVLLLLGEFAARRIARRGVARAGATLYALGAGAMVLAGLVNGFAVTALAQVAQRAPGGSDWTPVMHFAWALNQAAAGFGVLAFAAAVALWSGDLVQRPGLRRWVGAYGLACALLVAVALVGGALALDVRGFGAVVAALAVWQCGAGALLWRPGPA